MADGGQPPVGEAGHHIGQLVEPGLPGDQRIEGRVRSSSSAILSRSAVVRGPLRAGGGGPHLAGADAEATRMERATQRKPHLLVAVPAEVDDRPLRGQQVDRAL